MPANNTTKPRFLATLWPWPSRWAGGLDCLLLAALCLLLYFPGLTRIPALDRDESRFVQASRQMLESGNWVDIRFQEETRYKKPIGIYWLQAATVAVVGEDKNNPVWPYRIPSVLGIMLAVLATYGLGRQFGNMITAGQQEEDGNASLDGQSLGRFLGLAAAVMLAISIIAGIEARHAKTDGALLGVITLSQLVLAHICFGGRTSKLRHSGEGRNLKDSKDTGLRRYDDILSNAVTASKSAFPQFLWSVLWGVLIGVGILIKGPIILLVSFGTILTISIFQRGIRWLKPLRFWLGILVAAAVCVPWLLAITKASGGAFWQEAVGKDLLGKVGGAQESHGAPFGYHLALLWALFWPSSLVLLKALPWLWRQGTQKALDATVSVPVWLQFCIGWTLPTWLVFELTPTKLPHYPMITYPALALLAAAWLVFGKPVPVPMSVVNSRGKILGWLAFALWGAIGMAAASAFVVLPFLANGGEGVAEMLSVFHSTPFTGYLPYVSGGMAALAVLMLVFGSIKFWAEKQNQRWHWLFDATVTSMTIAVTVYGGIFPQLDKIWFGRTADHISQNLQQTGQLAGDTPLAIAGYGEPSMLIWLGTNTRLTTGSQAADMLAEGDISGVWVSNEQEQEFLNASTTQGMALDILASAPVFNYSKGDTLVMTLYVQDKQGTP